ncbi:hypothetical protein C8F04DRAFT_1190065 [Mycena alexandri]|uniref:Uncharacterized protein n=1 Tax=Mycena alexandri TaxID=1745969 RepID=A0AAD6SG03_9AGAR|nr:hypothetical protein C8F04DRAFT_1190065 [Mycena alexandri]
MKHLDRICVDVFRSTTCCFTFLVLRNIAPAIWRCPNVALPRRFLDKALGLTQFKLTRSMLIKPDSSRVRRPVDRPTMRPVVPSRDRSWLMALSGTGNPEPFLITEKNNSVVWGLRYFDAHGIDGPQRSFADKEAAHYSSKRISLDFFTLTGKRHIHCLVPHRNAQLLLIHGRSGLRPIGVGELHGTGLANVPVSMSNDWSRDDGAGHNSQTLVTASDLATQIGDSALAAAYLTNSTLVKVVYNHLLWDASAGMFHDNDLPNSIHPQDGNSLAVAFNLTTSAAQNQAISQGLTQFWTPIGPLSPELADTIIPFVGGLSPRFLRVSPPTGHSDTVPPQFTTLTTQAMRTASQREGDGPTPALTFYLLGIKLTTAQGATWSIAPVLSGLPSAEGGLETGLGFFGVNWTVSELTLTLVLETPAGTSGVVTLPGSGPVTMNTEVQPTLSDLVELEGGTHTLVRQFYGVSTLSGHNLLKFRLTWKNQNSAWNLSRSFNLSNMTPNSHFNAQAFGTLKDEFLKGDEKK